MDHKNIFVLMEINQGQLFPVSLELINIGKQLACQRKQELVAILIGKDIQKIAEERPVRLHRSYHDRQSGFCELSYRNVGYRL